MKNCGESQTTGWGGGARWAHRTIAGEKEEVYIKS